MFELPPLGRIVVFTGSAAALGLLIGPLWTTLAPRREETLLVRVDQMTVPQPAGRPPLPTADILAMAAFSSPSLAEGVAASQAPVQAPTMLRLHGLSISPARRAALISVSGGDPVWLTQGAEGPGFQVVSIQRDRVTVSAMGTDRELRLFSDSTPPSEDVAPQVAEASGTGVAAEAGVVNAPDGR